MVFVFGVRGHNTFCENSTRLARQQTFHDPLARLTHKPTNTKTGPPPAGALPVTPEEGPHGEETGAGAGAAGAGGAGVEAEAAHHRFLQQQWEAAQLPQPPQKQRRWWNQPRALWSRALAPAVPEPAAAPAAAAAEGAAAHAHAEEGAGAAGHGAEEAHGGAEEEHHGGGGHDTSPGCHPVCEPEPIHAVEYVSCWFGWLCVFGV